VAKRGLELIEDIETELADQERRLGEDDPLTVATRIRLGEAYSQLPGMDDEREDIRLWERLAVAAMHRAFRSRVRTLGLDHPDTLAVRVQLAYARFTAVMNDDRHNRAGKAALAATLRGVAEVRERTLGPDHPETLESWTVVLLVSRSPERERLQQRIVEGWRHVLAGHDHDPDHPESLEAMLRLANLVLDDERLALRLRVAAGWARVAAERIDRLGPLHPDTLDARERHVTLHTAFVRHDDGKVLYEAIVADHERLLGPDDPRTLHARIELLRHSGMPGNYDPRIIADAERLLDRIRTVLGTGHDDFGMLRYLLVSSHMIAGRFDAAEEVRTNFPSPSDDE
jgi:tetratricopeptide repeat protein